MFFRYLVVGGLVLVPLSEKYLRSAFGERYYQNLFFVFNGNRYLGFPILLVISVLVGLAMGQVS